MKFKIECEMKERWVPHFLAMLKYMETLGNMGSSRKVALYADGDGDFHPTFHYSPKLPDPDSILPISDDNGNHLYDAG